ncbi:hypothetical protein N9Z14_00305 [Opitutales bacterium]|nr:hypothetical protein [Opitutales bacterium]
MSSQGPSQEITNLYQGALKGLIEPLKKKISDLEREISEMKSQVSQVEVRGAASTGIPNQMSVLEARVINLEQTMEQIDRLEKSLDSITLALSSSELPSSKGSFLSVKDSKTQRYWEIPLESYEYSEFECESCLLVFTTASAVIEMTLTYEDPALNSLSSEYQKIWFTILQELKSSGLSQKFQGFLRDKKIKVEMKKTSLAKLYAQ